MNGLLENRPTEFKIISIMFTWTMKQSKFVIRTVT